jgi:ATP-dependent helicase HrpB
MPPLSPLPIDQEIPRILEGLERHRAVVVVAPPGSGKTTRVAPALCRQGPLILLQPRRVAARSIARRIAQEQEWGLGDEVGWQVRFERHYGARTRLLVATEGILTARLQSDPLLSDFKTIVLDEFHERSLHADVSLALARQAWQARDDLWLVVMSATLDPGPVREFLRDCPVVEAQGRLFPVEVSYWPDLDPAPAVHKALAGGTGHLLCFLPGVRELRKVQSELNPPGLPRGIRVYPLHGMLSADAQDAALAPCPDRKVILATNLAETSLTINGVQTVVDAGLEKLLQYDLERGLDRLELQRLSRDSAEQRAGRAGRTAPGRAFRLWNRADRLVPSRKPEILRVDLSAPVLDILAWGGDPRRFAWFEPPPPDRLEAALELLAQLGALEHGRLTPQGELLRRFPLHPRLAKILVEAGPTLRAGACCALLAERPLALKHNHTTLSDLLSQTDHIEEWPENLHRLAREIVVLARKLLGRSGTEEEEKLLRALFAGFPDRVARRRAPGSDRFLLASGYGARQSRESGVREAEFLVALDLSAGGGDEEGLIRQASLVRKEWLQPTGRQITYSYDSAARRVKAVERLKYHALTLVERQVPPDPEKAFPLLLEAWFQVGLDESSSRLLLRVKKAGMEVDLEAIARNACLGQVALPQGRLRDYLDYSLLAATDQLCPESLVIPSGRHARLDYREDGSVRLAVKLQELFGLAETPRAGKNREPVILDLLAPNGRPVQTTTDLPSFWRNTYPEVRKELRGRYPKHPWPEDPWTARPTAKTTRRGK